MRRGWYNDSFRHSLAAKGVRTYTKRKVRKTIPIIAERHEKGRVYPITKKDAKSFLARQDRDNLKGLKAIRFTQPRNKTQEGAWAQYLRGKREILVFAQPKHEVTHFSSKAIKKDVLDHELGHHVALYRRKKTDADIEMAEARADAFAAGFDVEDKDVKNFMLKPQNREVIYLAKKKMSTAKAPLKFYDLRAKKTFTTSDYATKKKKGRKFAIAKSPSGISSWRIMGK